MGRDPEAGAAMVDAWVRANPELAAKYPATAILRVVRWLREQGR